MTDYTETLANTEIAGVFEIPEGGSSALLAAASANAYLVYRIDFRKARSREEMLKSIGDSMGLPPWFGNNYDALVDCLCDLGWAVAPGYVLIVENCHNAHNVAAPDFNMILDLMAEIADSWREQGKPFWCFVDLPANV